MKTYERIPAFARMEEGKAVCICHARQKRCSRHCERVALYRDKFENWQNTMKRSRFGK